jgi:hypothetical protein
LGSEGKIAQVLWMISPEVGHEDFEISRVVRCRCIAGGENVSAAQSLDVQAKHVVTEEDASCGG